MRFLSLVLICLVFVGCKTIDVWDQGYPRSGVELTTDEQKKDEINKFAIAEGNARHSGEGYIQTQKDKTADNDKYYSLGSYSPVITKISPDAKKNLDEIRDLRKYHYIALAALLGSIFLDPDNSKSEALARNGLYAVGLGGIIGVSLWEASIFTDLKTNYNSDLNRHIYEGKKNGATEKKYSGLGLKLALNF